MTDATHIPTARPAASFSLDRFLQLLASVAEIDPTRRALSHLSELSDAEIAARGTSRADLVRRIVGARGMF